ncbi:glycosyltransferase family 4 protein [Meiothermus granaticius]|uniref:Putative undecaprenyl-phosphate N-acetylglucosaminyl 1-phosphate transferase n=1 Tax=Meiothermus granaticius NBRC 107808 TaxID=1227551 RepID=A0A399F996_9DEIN|nr:MraY family glycosyltransferase [Meiothermus granaticius]RIH92673.1 putative undecaprenyl-phosphate N-acetylglucosaminyl 1-phosphate transferase [Meiothermus granaticius NBRC 107808]GEM87561.1 undecaprenyl-phosphate alpha-N-acetylglucosaminyl 1-phosphate transferase [Meiothermus granaticius NBRC 107808]
MPDSLILLLTALSGVLLVGFSIPLARALGIVDKPGEIKIHTLPTPRFGGIGIVAALGLWGAMSGALSGWALLGLLIIAVTGGLDDRFSISPRLRLLAELGAGVVLGLHFWEQLGPIGVLLGVGLVPVMANAINLIDGMNGLASGNALVSSAGLALLLSHLGSSPTLALILLGGLLGFLVWNYPKAKTFMGDSGSLSIGYILAILLLQAANQGFVPFLAALTMVGFPLYDMASGIIRRARRGKPIFEGDRDHTYDRLDQIYLHNPTLTVAVVWVTTLLLVLLGWGVLQLALLPAFLLIAAALVVLFWGAYRLGSL